MFALANFSLRPFSTFFFLFFLANMVGNFHSTEIKVRADSRGGGKLRSKYAGMGVYFLEEKNDYTYRKSFIFFAEISFGKLLTFA